MSEQLSKEIIDKINELSDEITERVIQMVKQFDSREHRLAFVGTLVDKILSSCDFTATEVLGILETVKFRVALFTWTRSTIMIIANESKSEINYSV